MWDLTIAFAEYDQETRSVLIIKIFGVQGTKGYIGYYNIR